ncbi:MAG: acyl-CoA dehydrogenase [Acidimicrobiia bacterium]|nr:acyl-CoA dehydrogenase [Acidimicrobiia bacterium]
MTDYTPPLADIDFVLGQCGLEDVASLPDFAHVDVAAVPDLIGEAGRFFAKTIAPLNVIGDQVGSVHNPDNTVTTPPGFAAAYQQYVDAGWGAVAASPEYDGGGFPFLVGVAFEELMSTANLSFSMCPLLSQGASRLLEAHGSDAIKATYMPKMITGEWTGTMCLTEPEAGSDLGVIRTKAEPQADGTYRLTGTKIFITFGEHDFADQIVHLVLARTPDAPAGTKGISCFVVPKYLVNADGSLGARNDATCLSIEHKMGIKASPTCVMSFGENGEGAVGELVGELNGGLAAMFTMMNHARIGVAVEGLALAERSYQQAREYATERLQGRASTTPRGERAAIIEHPDVRRMLLTMESSIEAMRRLIYVTAAAIDLGEHHPDTEVRERNEEIAALFTPLAKAWSTDTGFEVTSIGVQIHGGMGFIEETGAAQHLRDARIAMIYEGTNGIQAMDLIGRKLGVRGGAVVMEHFDRIEADIAAISDRGLSATQNALTLALAATRDATLWMGSVTSVDDALAGATPYLRLLSMLTAGHLMVQSATLAAGTDRETSQKRTTRFFCEQLLPTATALVPAITAGAAALAPSN